MRALTVLLALLLTTPAQAQEYPQAKRVPSPGGAVTEIVYALGEEGRLAGRDQTSTWPEAAQELHGLVYGKE